MTKTICVARAASALVDKGAQYLRQKAERYRTLARAALDQYTTQALLKLATEYEARAAEAKSATAMTLWVTSTTTRIHSVIMLVVAPLLDD
jgi:hypothetical protein